MSAAVERTQPDSASDDGDNDADSGDDVAESSAGDDSKDDDSTKATPVANIFQRYASTPDARVAAEQFTPKRFDSPGGNTTHPNQFGERLSGIAPEFNATTDQADNAVRIVGGDSQVLDGNALRAVEQQIVEMQHAGGSTLALEAQRNAIRAPFIGVSAPLPVFRRPEVAAGLEAE